MEEFGNDHDNGNDNKLDNNRVLGSIKGVTACKISLKRIDIEII